MKKLGLLGAIVILLVGFLLFKPQSCKNLTNQQAIQTVQQAKHIQTASFLALDNKTTYSVKVGENKLDTFHTTATYEVDKCSGVVK